MTEKTNGLKELAEHSLQQFTTGVLLTVKQLEELGNELHDIMNTLEMNNLTLEGLQFIQNKEKNQAFWHLKNIFPLLTNKMKHYMTAWTKLLFYL